MKSPPQNAPETAQAAAEAGLRWIVDSRPGLRRVRSGRSFRYVGADGTPVRDEETLARIRRLAIPPAWTDVWISPIANGHLQATGRDAKGRKQYRYHARFRATRDAAKFDKLIEFGRALPKIRAAVRRDLARPALSREKVLATVVSLLEKSLIRVGSDEYAKTNRSYGLTTLRNHHAKVNGATVRFVFKGKSGIRHEVDVEDRHLASIVRRCQELPGQELFAYVDTDGAVKDVGSADVNEYLREVGGGEFTAKDFRTWAGTVLAATTLAAVQHVPGVRGEKKRIQEAIESVAKRLGNTPTVCRTCYVHPAVIDAWMDGDMAKTLARRAGRELRRRDRLPAGEAWLLRLLQRRLAAGRARTAGGLAGQLRRSLSAIRKRPEAKRRGLSSETTRARRAHAHVSESRPLPRTVPGSRCRRGRARERGGA